MFICLFRIKRPGRFNAPAPPPAIYLLKSKAFSPVHNRSPVLFDFLRAHQIVAFQLSGYRVQLNECPHAVKVFRPHTEAIAFAACVHAFKLCAGIEIRARQICPRKLHPARVRHVNRAGNQAVQADLPQIAGNIYAGDVRLP